jgi:hypothetical protein
MENFKTVNKNTNATYFLNEEELSSLSLKKIEFKITVLQI